MRERSFEACRLQAVRLEKEKEEKERREKEEEEERKRQEELAARSYKIRMQLKEPKRGGREGGSQG